MKIFLGFFLVTSLAAPSLAISLNPAANFQEQASQVSLGTVGAGLPDADKMNSFSQTAGVNSQIEDIKSTIQDLEDKIKGLPSCGCQVTTNPELDALSDSVADIQGKCSSLGTTESGLKTNLDSISGKISNALTAEDVDQMLSDVTVSKVSLDVLSDSLLASSATIYTQSEIESKLEAANSMSSKLSELETALTSCTAACSASPLSTSSADPDQMLKDLQALQNEGLSAKVGDLQLDVEANMHRVYDYLAYEPDTSFQDDLQAIESQLGDISTIIGDVEAARQSVVDSSTFRSFETDVNSNNIVTTVQESRNEFDTFKSDTNNLANSLKELTENMRSASELRDSLLGIDGRVSDVFTNNEQLVNKLAEANAAAGNLQSSFSSVEASLEFHSGVDVDSLKGDSSALGDTVSSMEATMLSTHKQVQDVFASMYPSECTPPFELLDDGMTCFYVVKVSVNYNMANDICKGLGGRLITLTGEKQSAIFKYLEDNWMNWYYHWVGVQKVSNGAEVWSDGSTDHGDVRFSTWNYGDCGEMDTSGNIGRSDCVYYSNRAICEKPIVY